MCHPKHIHSDRVSELSWAGYCILCTAVLKHAVRPISVCFSGWNTDARSRRKFPYQRLHWYNSGCFPSNFSKWWALNSAAVLFFSYQVLETLGNPVVIQCLCFTPHTSSCDMRKPLSLEGWRSVLSNSPISFLLWEKCSFSWCLSHMHTYRHILTNGLYPAVLLFPKATVMHFHFILIFLFVLPGLLWFMTTRRENEQWGQTKWILAVQTCRIELSSGFIAHWNICLHFSRQTKMLSGLLNLLRIDSDLHLYSHICTIRLADFER